MPASRATRVSAKSRGSQSSWKTSPSGTTVPKPCIPPMSCTPSMDGSYAGRRNAYTVPSVESTRTPGCASSERTAEGLASRFQSVSR